MVAAMRELNRNSEDIHMQVRVGLHAGPVVAGVPGMKRFAFDVWGETVNFASRMESAGAPGCINRRNTTCTL
jgi:class 3 adenylate cyclase